MSLSRRELIAAALSVPVVFASPPMLRGVLGDDGHPMIDPDAMYGRIPERPVGDVEFALTREGEPLATNIVQIFRQDYGLSHTLLATDRFKYEPNRVLAAEKQAAYDRLIEDLNRALRYGVRRTTVCAGEVARTTGGLEWMRGEFDRPELSPRDVELRILRPVSHRDTTEPWRDGLRFTWLIEAGLGLRWT